jgi:hypothetical protein
MTKREAEKYVPINADEAIRGRASHCTTTFLIIRTYLRNRASLQILSNQLIKLENRLAEWMTTFGNVEFRYVITRWVAVKPYSENPHNHIELKTQQTV